MKNGDQEKKKILILDDEKHVVVFFETLLRKNGYQPIPTYNVEEAYEAARREKPDLVILDLLMPKRTGTDFARKLSRDKELKHTPIIVVSGLAGRDLAVRKPAAVFDKPVDPDKFLAAVEEALACPREEAS
ncbi:MAG: response regulator [Candidatus Abyssobacteria bacterium SURF_5]|jgi:DNA-binding response OmpR family regulator|uniref:Response regulator n=1 Tax=Abyssobacteria bacterium (strain SURF_5) TaxID=2093360 RepID=A0A3A4N3V4_ABYX5|nr:MAG: response regulator [Candidatus Abyssubacteria bacterium SURF_5]